MSHGVQVNNRVHSSSDKVSPGTKSLASNIKGKETKEEGHNNRLVLEESRQSGIRMMERRRRDSPRAASAAGGNFRFRE
ncbi:unnamed protein product [Sphenostylis stenocarpa]|uniref:Uncharacterized protein n=1 Tax=Sphenostylis stenocarpa TaxID=92480 RepID=A0AA86TCR1_9FABA|nr:unnamed protein product [Sphenostylis stenocarpa]